MNTGIVVSMLAVGISLVVAFALSHTRKRKRSGNADRTDSGTVLTTGSGADCGPGDAGGCDGGGGGD